MAVHLKTTRIDDGKYRVELIDACRNCLGTGKLPKAPHDLDDYSCFVCNGLGRVKITKEITITISQITESK